MPGRNPELPEGTDHIVTGAAEYGATGAAAGKGDEGGFVASSPARTDTGGLDANTGASGTTGGLREQAAGGINSLKSQAGDKVRAYALDGKDRATGALDELAGLVSDAADQIDDRLGQQYGQYARQAADAVSGFADTVRNKDVDELIDDARDVVRKSPAVAIGLAAVVGFTLVRLLKAGLPEPAIEGDAQVGGTRDVTFVPDDVAASAGAGATA